MPLGGVDTGGTGSGAICRIEALTRRVCLRDGFIEIATCCTIYELSANTKYHTENTITKLLELLTPNNWRVWPYIDYTSGMCDRFHRALGFVLQVLVPNRNVVKVEQESYIWVLYWVNSMFNNIDATIPCFKSVTPRNSFRPYYVNSLEMLRIRSLH